MCKNIQKLENGTSTLLSLRKRRRKWTTYNGNGKDSICKHCLETNALNHDEELEAYTDALFQLTALEKPSRSEREAISVVRLLLEQHGLTQRDLIPEFGSESGLSMFLAKQRKLTLQQVRKLSARFKLPADAFIQSR
jgi:HTH-type transcriptional regulator/antitoxin HigA